MLAYASNLYSDMATFHQIFSVYYINVTFFKVLVLGYVPYTNTQMPSGSRQVTWSSMADKMIGAGGTGWLQSINLKVFKLKMV